MPPKDSLDVIPSPTAQDAFWQTLGTMQLHWPGVSCCITCATCILLHSLVPCLIKVCETLHKTLAPDLHYFQHGGSKTLLIPNGLISTPIWQPYLNIQLCTKLHKYNNINGTTNDLHKHTQSTTTWSWVFFCTTFGFIQVWPTTRIQQECAALIHYQ